MKQMRYIVETKCYDDLTERTYYIGLKEVEVKNENADYYPIEHHDGYVLWIEGFKREKDALRFYKEMLEEE